MKYLPLFIPLFLLSCRSFQTIPGDTYHHAHDLETSFAVPDSFKNVSYVSLRGVYSPPDSHGWRLNEFIWVHGNTVHHTFLADTLDVSFGDFVQISGQIRDTTLYRRRYIEQTIPLFHVEEVQFLFRTSEFFPLAQKDYQTLRGKMRKKVKSSTSRLEWPYLPNWYLYVVDSKSHVVVSFSKADLMYDLHVDMIYDLYGKKLLQLYAHEYFKGE